MIRTIVVADSGPLIALAIADQLELLATLFESIHIPQAVLDETTADRTRPGSIAIATFVQAHGQVHANRDDAIYASAVKVLDEGESQALSLAHTLACGVLIDERRGRQHARKLAIPVYGVLGLLLQAKRVGAIDLIGPSVDRLRRHGYRLSQALVDSALHLAGEAKAVD